MIDTRIISKRSVVTIGVTALVFAITAYVGSGFMQRAYISSVSMLSATEDNDNSLARVTNQLGAVAGLLGVGAGGTRRDVNESLATLRSRLLVADFIRAEEFLDDIIEILGAEQLAELSEEDRLQTAVSYFQDNILGVSFDTRSSLMVVSMTWTDRQRTAELANRYIRFANEAMRQRGIAAARNRIAFLDAAAKDAATVELRQAIYRVLEAQVNAEMMASTKPDYAFIIVDPAVPAGINEYVRPQTWLMVVVAAMFGAVLAAAALFYFRGQVGAPRPL